MQLLVTRHALRVIEVRPATPAIGISPALLYNRRMGNFNIAVDGSIVGLYLLATMVAGMMVRKYVGKVEHFLVAGREMNVYLGIASLAATEFGIVTCMYTAQNGYEYGFAGATPGILYAAGHVLRRLDRLLHQAAARRRRHDHPRAVREDASARGSAGRPAW